MIKKIYFNFQRDERVLNLETRYELGGAAEGFRHGPKAQLYITDRAGTESDIRTSMFHCLNFIALEEEIVPTCSIEISLKDPNSQIISSFNMNINRLYSILMR